MEQPFKKQQWYSTKNKINTKKLFFVKGIRMLNLSLNELKLIAKNRGIKGYKSMFEDRLLSTLNASESVKESETMLDPTKNK